MKVYENIIIGNFLYALGYAVAANSRNVVRPSVINLLQQTNADTKLCDLLVQFPGTFRLIEFKRAENKSVKENKKNEKFIRLLNVSDDHFLKTITRQCHWYIETSTKNKTLASRIVPYVDAFISDDKPHDFWSFVDDTALSAIGKSEQFSKDEIEAYLKFVIAVNDDGDVTTGGMILMIGPDGKVNHCQLGSFDELNMNINQIREIRSVEIEKQRQKTKEIQRGLDMGSR